MNPPKLSQTAVQELVHAYSLLDKNCFKSWHVMTNSIKVPTGMLFKKVFHHFFRVPRHRVRGGGCPAPSFCSLLPLTAIAGDFFFFFKENVCWVNTMNSLLWEIHKWHHTFLGITKNSMVIFSPQNLLGLK